MSLENQAQSDGVANLNPSGEIVQGCRKDMQHQQDPQEDDDPFCGYEQPCDENRNGDEIMQSINKAGQHECGEVKPRHTPPNQRKLNPRKGAKTYLPQYS